MSWPPQTTPPRRTADGNTGRRSRSVGPAHVQVHPPFVARGRGGRLVGRKPRSRSIGPPLNPLWPPPIAVGRAAKFPRARTRSRAVGPLPRRRYLDARGLYRIFNAAEYRLYRSALGPPNEGMTPFATSETLPHTPDETFGDGVWYLAISWFNGVLDSGFLPVGADGETYLKIKIADGQAVAVVPNGPLDWRLEQSADGVVRVVGVYFQSDANRADEWALAYTVDGGDPPADDPDITATAAARGLCVFDYSLPGAADGSTVKVRLQTRRNDGTDAEPVWVYSVDSEVKTIAADAVGPGAPAAADRWTGVLVQTED